MDAIGLIIEGARNIADAIERSSPTLGVVAAACIAIVWLTPLGGRILDGLGNDGG